MPNLTEVTSDGRLRYHFHRGQWRAWQSERRFVAAIAGTQGGKTVFGPVWLWREIQRRGPGDYLVVTPTFPLLTKKALPEFLRLFQRQLRLGEYLAGRRMFVFSVEGEIRAHGEATDVPTQVYFGHASDPESLESATARGLWCDEAGQKKFRLGSWEALQRRLSVHTGRALITTTPYDLGWLKQQVYDRWKSGDPDYDVVRFDSTENPAFPAAEFERARRTLPRWKFDLFYRGIFTRPAGLIYDSFDPGLHVCPPFAIPAEWERYVGIDFGGVNTAAVFFAEDPGNRRLYAYREYHQGGRTAAQHAAALRHGEPGVPLAAGGSGSEQQWRDEFCAAGFPVAVPDLTGPDSIEPAINRVWGAFAAGRLRVFSTCTGLLDELGSYAREVDEYGNTTEKIEDPHGYHLLDACRYIVPSLVAPRGPSDDGPTVARA